MLPKFGPTFEYVTLRFSNNRPGDPTWGPSWRNDGGFILSWAAKDIGFGELTFVIPQGEERVVCKTEGRDKTFIAAAMQHFLTTVEYKDK